jgi:hypothetical protein
MTEGERWFSARFLDSVLAEKRSRDDIYQVRNDNVREGDTARDRLLRVSGELAMTEELSRLALKLTSGMDDCLR